MYNSATEEEDKSGPETCLYVKVSMEGAPYLRKIDLKTYKSYVELSSALEKMFSCFTLGQFGSHGGCGRDGLNESRVTDLLRGSEYVVAYEDKDSDWMLVGDVPWESVKLLLSFSMQDVYMFGCSCQRLRIMKSSEAIWLRLVFLQFFSKSLFYADHSEGNGEMQKQELVRIIHIM
ncbi:hypothetical protein IGI04_031496 [Brassica rapa subsp. trilocularis]|uniref:Auxin-responsive protein n=1 Tax=Brassica rapa subsp. trilocularis TaxID=1813537 RepID=A0ABQ7LTS5_BRACM|nr:hypothetical protein IGI04_031496 [Brassica rapa subsp. trilocularis]